MPKPQRSLEHFKYRNAAVRQGTILGNEKLVLITCAEFCNDNGIFWHGLRSLAKATGLGYGTVQREMDTLRERGVLKVLRRGRGRFITNKYQILLDKIPLKPTIYDLVTHDREAENERPTLGQLEPEAAHSGPQLTQGGSKDVDLDVDLNAQDGDLKAASQPAVTLFQTLDENQSQHQSKVNGELGQKHNYQEPIPQAASLARKGLLAQAAETPTSNPAPQPPSSAVPPSGTVRHRPCQDCGARPVWRGRWCDHCHAEGPYAG